MTYGSNLFGAYYNAQRTAKAYVQDGLIAMWDGIENAGWGVHDGNATSWVNLVDGVQATRHDATKQPVWGADHWESTASNEGQAFDTMLPAEVVGAANLSFEVVTMRKGTARGVICGNYGIAAGNGINMENYLDQKFRAYWDNAPSIVTAVDLYPVDAITYFGTSHNSSNQCRIWDSTGTDIATGSGSGKFNRRVFRIGADGRVGQGMCFYGNIYCIRIYNRALTAAEIAHNYAIDKIRFSIA